MAVLAPKRDGTTSLAAVFASTFAATADGKGTLRLEDRAFVSDKLNANNPLMAYASGIQIADVSAGSVTIKYNEDYNGFAAKSGYGNGEVKGVKVKTEVLLWEDPKQITEAMTAYDLKKGAVNVLAGRLAHNGVVFVQDAIKAGFDKLAVAGNQITAAAKPTTGKAVLKEIVDAATKLMNDTQYPREAITITVESLLFNELALEGFVGDRMTQSFEGGQFQIGTLMGFKIQSSEMFQGTNKFDYMIGTNDSVVYNTDVIAANVERLGISNDMGTYIEMARIAEAPARTDDKNLVQWMKWA